MEHFKLATQGDVLSLKEVCQSVSDYFKREQFDYAIIGAFALYGYGYVRATKDVDFITRLQYESNIVAFLESLGFETLHRSESFSNHLHPIGAARVDIMYVDGKTADEILSSTKEMILFNNVTVPVVSAEHLVALKLFAGQNNSERLFKELSDIKELLARSKVNPLTVKNYFAKYGMEKYYDETIGNSK